MDSLMKISKHIRRFNIILLNKLKILYIANEPQTSVVIPPTEYQSSGLTCEYTILFYYYFNVLSKYSNKKSKIYIKEITHFGRFIKIIYNSKYICNKYHNGKFFLIILLILYTAPVLDNRYKVKISLMDHYKRVL